MRHAMDFARDKKTILIDGVKVILNDREWVLILPDPDKPFVNVTIESSSEKQIENLIVDIFNKIESWKEIDT